MINDNIINSATVVGQMDGRTIWLSYQCIGRLRGDPLYHDMYDSSTLAAPGGYLEAVGGRVYELGEPRLAVSTPQPQPTRNPFSLSPLSSNPNNNHDDKGSELDTEFIIPGMSWIPATTSTVSAMLACTILSASIGYGAGLGVISDPSHAATTTPAPPTLSTSTSRARNSDNIPTMTSASPPSVAERRARMESKVLPERRFIDMISDQVKKDEAELGVLRQQESQDGPLLP